MSIQRIFPCCLVLLLLCFVCFGATQEKSQRDLSTYADGGSYELTWAVPREEELEKRKEKVRDFIWEQWQRKQRGHISLRDCTTYPEGPDDSMTYNFYIEPNKDGSWQLIKEYDHYISAELNGGKAENYRGIVIYSNVEKIKAGDINDCPAMFSGKPELYPKNYRLCLTKSQQSKDKSAQPCVIL